MGDIEVFFGGVSLVCRDYQITDRINDVSVATFRFNKSDFLKLGAVGYLDEVIANRVSSKSRVFAGNIVSITEEPNNQLSISLVRGVELTETIIKDLTVAGIEHQEQFYSMARLGGFPPDKLHIFGLNNSNKDMVAFIPFKGFVVEADEVCSDVQILSRTSILASLPKTIASEKWSGFLDADGWISFHCTNPHFIEAEALALEKADVFLSAYSGILQYSYSLFDGDFIAWERSREAINLKRQDYILLVVQSTNAAWLRDVSPAKPTQTKLRPSITIDIEAVMGASESFYLPLLIWNRFRDSEDYYIVTIGLWQIIELLSSGIKSSVAFSDEQLQDLAARAVANLTEEEKPPILAAIKRLNERPLMEKFNKHLENIKLVLSKEERKLLKQFREIRNKIEHGAKPKEPSLPEIKRVKALANRVVLASLKQAKSKTQEGESPSQ
jgi:hypothetical protein